MTLTGMRPSRRRFVTGLAAAGVGLVAARHASAVQHPMRPYRGLYRPPGFPRLADDPVTEFLADAWQFDGSAYDPNQGAFGAPLWGLSVRGYPYRTQFAAFSPATTTAGQGCGFNGTSQYVWTTVGAGRGPWSGARRSKRCSSSPRSMRCKAAAQTLMGIEGHAVPRRASMQIAANSTKFLSRLGDLDDDDRRIRPIGGARRAFRRSIDAGLQLREPRACSSAKSRARSRVLRRLSINGTRPISGTRSWPGSTKAITSNGVMLFAAAWNTVLPDAMIFDLLQDPFGFLIFPDDDMMSDAVGAAAAARSLRSGAHGFPR